MTKTPVELTVENGVGTLSLNRPERKNAFNYDMWIALANALDAAELDESIKVVLIESGVKGVFSTGADLEEFERVAKDPTWREKNRQALGEGIGKLMTLSKPSIAVVDGPAMGAGCGVALAADIRLASKLSKFCIPPAKLGLVYPLQETKRLVDIIGPARAKEMLYTGDVLDAYEAERIGLVNRVVYGNVKAAAVEMAEKMAANSSHSLAEGKKMIRRVMDGQRSESDETIAAFLDAYDGDDFSEGAKAFLEKRKPTFK